MAYVLSTDQLQFVSFMFVSKVIFRWGKKAEIIPVGELDFIMEFRSCRDYESTESRVFPAG